MKLRLSATFLCVLLVAMIQAQAAVVLPDACGSDKVKFKVTQPEQPVQPAQPVVVTPDAGKALIVFVETMDKGTSFCIPCADATTRVGMDGAWVGANYGNSYFTLAVTPGEHHLCTDWQSSSDKLKQLIGLTSFTAEAGKVYYFQVKVTDKAEGQYIKKDLQLMPLNEDEGKFRLKVSAPSTFKSKK